jgi:Iap family predicted aminopeptidase
MTYARRTGDFEHVHAAINFDGIGPYMAATSVAVFAASEPFKQRVRDLKTAFPGMIEVEPWPASDHYIFYSHGAPSLALSSLGVKDIYHTPEDSLEWISPDKLAEAVLLAEQVVRERGHEEFRSIEHFPD